MELLLLLLPYLVYVWFTRDKPDKPDPSFIPTRTPRKYTGNQFMSAEEKQEYLNSVQWLLLKGSIRTRDNHKCQHCGSTKQLEVHHTTYINLGAELPEQLVTVCRCCHQSIHDKLGYDRTTEYPISILDK